MLAILSPFAVAQEDEFDVNDVDMDMDIDAEESDAIPINYHPPEPFVPLVGPRAKLVINKRMITPVPGLYAAGKPIQVSISVFNAGDAAAHTVSIGDNWGELFDITEGTNSTMIDVLDVGANTDLNFTVVPQREGHFTGGAASVTYAAQGEGSRLQTAYSTGYRQFTVYPTDVYDKYSREKTFEWTVLGLGSAAAILLPFGIWLNIQLNKKNVVKTH